MYSQAALRNNVTLRVDKTKRNLIIFSNVEARNLWMPREGTNAGHPAHTAGIFRPGS